MRIKKMITTILFVVFLAGLSVQGQTHHKRTRQREQHQQKGNDSLKIDYKAKIVKSATVIAGITIFGGCHYIIDMIWGKGWILGKILRLF